VSLALQRKVTVNKSVNLDVDDERSKLTNNDTLKNVTNQLNSKDSASSKLDKDLALDNKNDSNEYLSNSENNENIFSNDSSENNVSSRLSELINSNLPGIEKSISNHLVNNSIQSELIQDCDSDENNDEISNKGERKQNSNYDDSYHKPLARNGLTSLSGNRKGIKKTKVNK
jgi:hypothetical protein